MLLHTPVHCRPHIGYFHLLEHIRAKSPEYISRNEKPFFEPYMTPKRCKLMGNLPVSKRIYCELFAKRAK